MRDNSRWIRAVTYGGVIAAAYTALTLVLAPIAYGPIQCRLSEALTVLPIFTPHAVWGLALGCALSNAAGIALGTSVTGLWDVVLGTAATLLAAVLTRLTRKIRWFGLPVLSTLFPVLVNAVVLGGMFTVVETGGLPVGVLLLNMAYIAAGQAAACCVGGLVLYKVLRRTPVLNPEGL